MPLTGLLKVRVLRGDGDDQYAPPFFLRGFIDGTVERWAEVKDKI